MPKYDGIQSLRLALETAQPFKDALSVLERTNHYADLIQNPMVDKIGAVNLALTQGTFDTILSTRLQELYRPFEEYQLLMDTLGKNLVKPSVYENISSALLTVTDRLALIDQQAAIKNIGTGLSVLTSATQLAVDTTWLHDESAWAVTKSALSTIDTAGLTMSSLTKLALLEHETSLLDSPALQQITSAASQIASIQEAICPTPQITRLLDDFTRFASNQHLAIQKSISDQAEVEWRLGAIDAASRFVDRQVKWTEAIAEEIPDGLNSGKIEEGSIDGLPSPVSQIGFHIGYSNRKNVAITPEEALGQSTLVEITEKGKKISENIVILNELMKDRGEEDVFKYTDKVAKGFITMSTMVCTSDAQMGSIIDALYFIFYENIERIKKMIGGGDKKIGNQIVRENDTYQCIFNVKTIRSDLRHDLDHGRDAEIKKKLMDVGDCYKHYCKQRPLKAKDYKMLQLGLYDEFLSLEEELIERVAID